MVRNGGSSTACLGSKFTAGETAPPHSKPLLYEYVGSCLFQQHASDGIDSGVTFNISVALFCSY